MARHYKKVRITRTIVQTGFVEIDDSDVAVVDQGRLYVEIFHEGTDPDDTVYALTEKGLDAVEPIGYIKKGDIVPVSDVLKIEFV